ncbi:MAG: biopolymer transport protein ExbB/TolQ [Planctomycetota bacterium]|jgi:biopolymer transport protein ExbB/TolQ
MRATPRTSPNTKPHQIAMKSHAKPVSAAPKRTSSARGRRADTTLIFAAAAVLMVAFYGIFPTRVFHGTVLARYFTHPVEHVTVALFFVAVAGLGLRWLHLRQEAAALAAMGAKGADCGGAAALGELTPAQMRTDGATRLRAASSALPAIADGQSFLDYLQREEDTAFDQMESKYTGVKVIQWCIPIVGFLGTVVGITAAIANLSTQNLDQSMTAAVGGLSTAFDTTALALALSLMLAPVIHAVSQRHFGITLRVNALLRSILKQPAAKASTGDSLSDLAKAVREQSQTMSAGFSTLQGHAQDLGKVVANQLTEAGRRVSIEATEAVKDAVSTSAAAAAGEVSKALAVTSRETLESLGNAWRESAGKLEQTSVEMLQTFTSQWEPAMSGLSTVASSVEGMAKDIESSSDAVKRHSKVLQEAVGSTREIIGLERSLNQNLAALEAMETWQELQASLTSTFTLLQGSVKAQREPTRRVNLTVASSNGKVLR